MDEHPKDAWSKLPNNTFINALRSFEDWRRRVQGINDNAGAIHSAERLAELLSLKVAYPGLTHINKLRYYKLAWFSKGAKMAFDKDEKAKIEIEHIFPKRVYTVELLRKIGDGATNEEITKWISENFKLALLTPDERTPSWNIPRRSSCWSR